VEIDMQMDAEWCTWDKAMAAALRAEEAAVYAVAASLHFATYAVTLTTPADGGPPSCERVWDRARKQLDALFDGWARADALLPADAAAVGAAAARDAAAAGVAEAVGRGLGQLDASSAFSNRRRPPSGHGGAALVWARWRASYVDRVLPALAAAAARAVAGRDLGLLRTLRAWAARAHPAEPSDGRLFALVDVHLARHFAREAAAASDRAHAAFRSRDAAPERSFAALYVDEAARAAADARDALDALFGEAASRPRRDALADALRAGLEKELAPCLAWELDHGSSDSRRALAAFLRRPHAAAGDPVHGPEMPRAFAAYVLANLQTDLARDVPLYWKMASAAQVARFAARRLRALRIVVRDDCDADQAADAAVVAAARALLSYGADAFAHQLAAHLHALLRSAAPRLEDIGDAAPLAEYVARSDVLAAALRVRLADRLFGRLLDSRDENDDAAAALPAALAAERAALDAAAPHIASEADELHRMRRMLEDAAVADAGRAESRRLLAAVAPSHAADRMAVVCLAQHLWHAPDGGALGPLPALPPPFGAALAEFDRAYCASRRRRLAWDAARMRVELRCGEGPPLLVDGYQACAVLALACGNPRSVGELRASMALPESAASAHGHAIRALCDDGVLVLASSTAAGGRGDDVRVALVALAPGAGAAPKRRLDDGHDRAAVGERAQHMAAARAHAVRAHSAPAVRAAADLALRQRVQALAVRLVKRAGTMALRDVLSRVAEALPVPSLEFVRVQLDWLADRGYIALSGGFDRSSSFGGEPRVHYVVDGGEEAHLGG
jgi:hypothetical protein